MSNARESGVGSRGSEPPRGGDAPTPDPRLPTPVSPNWPFLYSAVLIELAVLIIVFYAFTKAFA